MPDKKLDQKKAHFHSTEYPGVVYLVARGGSRHYYIKYRTPDGRQHFEKCIIPGVKMSAAKASGERGNRKDGIKPGNRDRREAERAVVQAEAGKRGTVKADQRYRKHLKDRFGSKEPKDLLPLDIDRMRLSLSEDHAKETTISVISLLHRITRYGASKGHCPALSFPIILKGKKLGRDPRVKRVPTPEQIDAYEKTCREWPDPLAGAFQLFIRHTGVRRGSVRDLKWEDVHLDRFPETALLKDSKTGYVEIVLGTDTVNLLLNHPRIEGNPYVFAGSDPDGKRSQRQVDRIPRKIADAAGLPKDLDPCHSFRRFGATSRRGKDLHTTMRSYASRS